MPASQKASPESAIFAALEANNPFEKPPVVREQNIWGESFPDVPSINTTASDALFNAVQQVKQADSSLDKVTTLVFLADRGTGKSHVIKRIRRRLQSTGEGVFIYASADKYGSLSLVNLLFQQSIAESLEQIGSSPVTQWQEIATLIVAEAIVAGNPNATVPTPEALVKNFDRFYLDRRKQGKDLVGQLVRAIRRLSSDIDPYILRAVIWTLSEERGSLAVKWLAGEELTTQDAEELSLPSNQKSENETNAAAPTTVVKLLSLIGRYKTAVICFDELDSAITDENGFTAPYVIVNLVKRLFDAIAQSAESKGVVMITSVLPAAWRQMRLNIQTSIKRISAFCDPIGFSNVNEHNIIDLCTLTLDTFYEKRNLVAPTPIYPFTEEELIAFAKGRPSPRESFGWLAEQINQKLKNVSSPSLTPTERFEKAYQNALSQFDLEDLNTNEVTANALRFCFQKISEDNKLSGQPIEGVVVKGVEDITPSSKNNGRLHFKIIGEENGETVIIGLGVIQETYGRSVAAGFRRLLDTETFGLSRGCLVRSRDRRINRSWDSYEYYQQLLANGGEWVDLTAEDIKPLLALQYVYEHHEKFDLTHKRLDSFAFTRNLLQNNPLIKEILSRPEGNLVEEALEGEELKRLNDDDSLESLVSDLSQSYEDPASNAVVQSDMKEISDILSA